MQILFACPSGRCTRARSYRTRTTQNMRFRSVAPHYTHIFTPVGRKNIAYSETLCEMRKTSKMHHMKNKRNFLLNLFSGRLGRAQYLGGFFLVSSTVLLLLFSFMLLGGNIPSYEEVGEDIYLLFLGILRLPFLPLAVRRFQDIGWKYSWIWAFISVFATLGYSGEDYQNGIMLLAIALNICLFLWPGSKEKNKYGPKNTATFFNAILNKA